MKTGIKKIAVLGPESSGKTELCMGLAAHYNTVYVMEFARSYLPGLGRPYTADDLLFIAQNQLQSEKEALLNAHKLLFCDTELINLKQWCLHKFGFCHKLIEEELNRKPYDFYLLTAPDLPWIYDPLRENPDKGNYFYLVYKNEIERSGFPYAIVSGEGSLRIACAIKAVESFLSRT
ncbi:MAG: ATP-binding protein [Bacteroidia bacterium]|nr:ATP-binding protein [Bacteroidia bacterium]